MSVGNVTALHYEVAKPEKKQENKIAKQSRMRHLLK